MALEHAANVDGMYIDESENGLSFHKHGDLLLVSGGWHVLQDFAAKRYPKATEKYHWATQDCISLDSIPYIGPYSASTSGLYVATGFNKWGMTTAIVSAMISSDLVQCKTNPYADVFSPSRSIPRPQLAVNGWEAMVSLLTPTTRRCPHLGCALKWNPQEHTWDCPCHGSRFAEDGKRIDGPAAGDLKL